MSGAPATTPSGALQPGLRVRIAAVIVLIALAGLAAYAVFSPPTTVRVGGPAKSAPAVQPTQGSEGGAEPEGGGERGD